MHAELHQWFVGRTVRVATTGFFTPTYNDWLVTAAAASGHQPTNDKSLELCFQLLFEKCLEPP